MSTAARHQAFFVTIPFCTEYLLEATSGYKVTFTSESRVSSLTSYHAKGNSNQEEPVMAGSSKLG